MVQYGLQTFDLGILFDQLCLELFDSFFVVDLSSVVDGDRRFEVCEALLERICGESQRRYLLHMAMLLTFWWHRKGVEELTMCSSFLIDMTSHVMIHVYCIHSR